MGPDRDRSHRAGRRSDSSFTSGRGRLLVDAFWRARSYRRLGELYEQRGDTAKAVEYYNEFVELWKDADPELQPQVEDVKRRLAALVGEAR